MFVLQLSGANEYFSARLFGEQKFGRLKLDRNHYMHITCNDWFSSLTTLENVLGFHLYKKMNCVFKK